MDKIRGNVGDSGQQPLAHSCSLGVITFNQHKWSDHNVSIVEISENGVLVESDDPIEAGFVWFSDRVRGHKGGILIGCLQHDANYRGIIQFVPLTRDEERTVQEKTLRISGHRPHRSPEEIIAVLLQSVERTLH